MVVQSQTRQRGTSMTVIGYARVSTTDQDLSIQEAALKAAGCQVIRAEKRSGTTTEGREALRTVLEFLHAGDVLMVTRIDRLARSIGDLQDIVRTVRARGAVLKATEQPIDTGTAAGKCFLDMLGVFAEFETNLRRERQLEGIAKAKAAGVYKGRPPSIEASRVREIEGAGHAAGRYRQGAQHRPCVGLSGVGTTCDRGASMSWGSWWRSPFPPGSVVTPCRRRPDDRGKTLAAASVKMPPDGEPRRVSTT
jgi:DNA invertase Pin-like site-specific DNA recombinase